MKQRTQYLLTSTGVVASLLILSGCSTWQELWAGHDDTAQEAKTVPPKPTSVPIAADGVVRYQAEYDGKPVIVYLHNTDGTARIETPGKQSVETLMQPPPRMTTPTTTLPAWNDTGFDADTVIQWHSRGFSPDNARQWRDAGFSAPQAILWKNAGIAPEQGRQWLAAGFLPQEASRWHSELQMTPQEATAWRESGFSFEQVSQMRGIGLTPGQTSWSARGFSASEVLAWYERNFSPDDAANWRDKGFAADEANLWRSIGMEATQAGRWRDFGFSFEQARQFKELGLQPNN